MSFIHHRTRDVRDMHYDVIYITHTEWDIIACTRTEYEATTDDAR